MIHIVGRREPRIFVVEDEKMTAPNVKEQFRQDVSSYEVLFTTLTPRSPDRQNRKRGIDQESGLTFVELLSTTSGKVYIQESPYKSNKYAKTTDGEVLFKNIPPIAELRKNSPKLFDQPVVNNFNFEITKKDIKSRIGVKRTTSQNQVVGC